MLDGYHLFQEKRKIFTPPWAIPFPRYAASPIHSFGIGVLKTCPLACDFRAEALRESAT
jgi:hypothetical protein